MERASHRLKVIDFGLSKHLASAQTLGVGTPDYMAPEMLQQGHMYHMYGQQYGGQLLAGGAPATAAGPAARQPTYDARAVDAWAMGVLLYLLVTGKYPFEVCACVRARLRARGHNGRAPAAW